MTATPVALRTIVTHPILSAMGVVNHGVRRAVAVAVDSGTGRTLAEVAYPVRSAVDTAMEAQ